MTVYVDDMRVKVRVGRTLGVWSHLTADSSEELMCFAESIGLKREWLQCSGSWKEHFDVTEVTRRKAVKAGAVEITYREHVIMLNKRRKEKQ